jgi:alpha-tubulin suppressor-like RCC1 family protein
MVGRSDLPVQVVDAAGTGTLTSVQAIAAGAFHTCAALSDGSAWCWGQNDYGQLGDGTNNQSYTPVQVADATGVGTIANVQSIATGAYHTCAALSDGSAWCWGQNTQAQLGDGSNNSSNTPVQVLGAGGMGTLTDVVEIAAGWWRTCALLTGNTLWCWGQGPLGDGTTGSISHPVQVGLAQTSSPAVGHGHSCALVASGTAAACWGDSVVGQLGDGQWAHSDLPVTVASLTNIADIAAGELHTCAALNGGDLLCWGSNDNGQLGNPDYFHQPSPVTVLGF